jgi:hypothetical protein
MNKIGQSHSKGLISGILEQPQKPIPVGYRNMPVVVLLSAYLTIWTLSLLTISQGGAVTFQFRDIVVILSGQSQPK